MTNFKNKNHLKVNIVISIPPSLSPASEGVTVIFSNSFSPTKIGSRYIHNVLQFAFLT